MQRQRAKTECNTASAKHAYKYIDLHTYVFNSRQELCNYSALIVEKQQAFLFILIFFKYLN